MMNSFAWAWNLSVTLRGEHKMRVYENGVLRTVLEHKKDDIIRRWKKVEKLLNLNSS
jgi:hypothetical protein